MIHFIAEDDQHAVLLCQKLLSFLPSQQSGRSAAAWKATATWIRTRRSTTSCRSTSKKGYDVRDVITKVVDFGDFLEVQAGYATEHRGRVRAH